MQQLTPELREKMEEYVHRCAELSELQGQEDFRAGLRLGMQLAIEALHGVSQ